MRNSEVVQLVLTREPGDLRGAGPLQRCGAAVSVAVEANQYAANYYSAGGVPSVLVKSAVTLDDDETAALKAQWIESAPNIPRVIDPTIDSVEVMGSDPEKAGISEQRTMNTGDVAREFGIPGALLEYQSAGSSLTYQNVSEVYVQFVRTCLAPNYLEPIEQAMNDLLTRSTVTRFNVDGLLRADIKTRYDVHGVAIDKGIYDAVYAQAIEGIAPGSVETAPIPPAQPAADITSLAGFRSAWTGSLEDLRCSRCGRLAGRVSGPAEIRCNRCGATVVRAA
jgi:HK97 family phage portal protein